MPSSLNLRESSQAGRAEGWDRFFFRPADPLPLGLIRAACGLLLLWSVGCLGLDLPGFLGSTGWADPGTLRALRTDSAPWEWSLWNLVPDGLLTPSWAAAMGVLAAFTLGLGSRYTAPLAWAIAVSTSRRNPFILFGFDQVVALWTFYLAITGASGQAFSLDRLIAARRGKTQGPPRPTTAANLALRLVQVHLCVIYGAAGLAKLRGVSWWDGTAMLKLLSNAEFRPFDLMSWLSGAGSLYALNLATHLSLGTELAYPILIWKRGFRPWLLLAAVVMHVGIALTLGLLEFSAAMLAGNLAFVSGEGLRRLWGRRHGSGGGSPLEWSDEPPPSATWSARGAASGGRPRR